VIRGRFTGALDDPQHVPQKRKYKKKPAITGGQLCANCQKVGVLAKGRCSACYQYHHRYGKERPLYYSVEKCLVCGERDARKKGRCERCYQYLLVFGVDRTKRESSPRWCKNCGHRKTHGLGRCNPCYRHFRRYGKERPRYKWDVDACCKTCGVRLKTVNRAISGYCEACYEYYRKDLVRPRYLWGIGTHGWCECGYPAEHKIDDFCLCNRCVEDYK